MSSIPFESKGVHGTQFLEKLDLLEVRAYKMFVLSPHKAIKLIRKRAWSIL